MGCAVNWENTYLNQTKYWLSEGADFVASMCATDMSNCNYVHGFKDKHTKYDTIFTALQLCRSSTGLCFLQAFNYTKFINFQSSQSFVIRSMMDYPYYYFRASYGTKDGKIDVCDYLFYVAYEEDHKGWEPSSENVGYNSCRARGFTNPYHVVRKQLQDKNSNKILLNSAKDECKKIGYKENTEEFGNCVLKLSK